MRFRTFSKEVQKLIQKNNEIILYPCIAEINKDPNTIIEKYWKIISATA